MVYATFSETDIFIRDTTLKRANIYNLGYDGTRRDSTPSSIHIVKYLRHWRI